MKRKRGQSLFEVVIAVGVIAVVLVALVSLVVTSQRNQAVSTNRAEAARLSQELSEWLRGRRDTSWTTFYTNTGVQTLCFPAFAWGNLGACSSTETIDGIFIREATFTRPATDRIGVTIVVRWTDSQGTHTNTNQTEFTNWRND